MGRLNTLDAWLDYQENLHLYEIDLGLDRVQQVYKKLFPKKHNFKIITVAGTNGKGSTLAFLESIYTQAEYRVGKFTSPHLFIYNERISVNQKNVSDEDLCEAFLVIEKARKNISLSYFEFSALASLWIFEQQKIEIALLEVGLGGRLDAINVVDSDVAVITNIELDHTQYLGNTREKIAIEKMGIMRHEKPCLSAEQNPPASMLGKKIIFVNEKYQGALSLLGEHQKHNAQLALETVQVMDLKVSENEKKQGLLQAKITARQQVVNYQDKKFIFDVAHNPASVEALAKTVAKLEGETVAIFAALKDKNIKQMIDKIAPFVQQWFLMPLQTNRSILPKAVQEFCPNALICSDAEIALNSALKTQAKNIIVFGSFLTITGVFNAL